MACGLSAWLAFAAVGCNKSSSSNGSARVDENVFDSAPAELKEAWNVALGAARSNDLATAYITLTQLRGNRDLSEAQAAAIGVESVRIHAQIDRAAAKGDAAALKALQDIRSASRRGR